MLLFLMFGSSGQASSKMLKVLVFLSMMVISGLSGLMQTSSGIVPPVVVVWPVVSLRN